MLATTVPDYRTTLGYCTYAILLQERERMLEKARVAQAKWKAANPGKAQASCAKWKAANPEKYTEASRRAKAKQRAANPEKTRAAARAAQARQRAANPEKYKTGRRAIYLNYKYSLTFEQVKQMRVDQGGKCAICGKEKKLVVDHCHATGKVRGLLCHGCNVGLGRFGDSLSGLSQASAYLQKYGP